MVSFGGEQSLMKLNFYCGGITYHLLRAARGRIELGGS